MPQYKKKLKRGLRWYYRLSFQGVIYRSNAIYLSKQDAKKAELSRLNEIELKMSSPQNEDFMLLDLINERLDYLKAAKSEKYYKDNRRYFKILYEYIGNIKVSDLTKNDINKLLIAKSVSQKQKNQDNYVVNAMLRSFKSLIYYGINYLDINMKNPCTGLELMSIKKKMKYIPTDKEINKILKKCNPEQKLLVEFVRDTGCRISEALNLRRRDVFNGYVALYTRKSKSSNLTPREAKFDTTKFTLPKKNDDKIFYQWAEEPKFLTRKTKGNWSWHNLRHRYASILSKNNTPLFEIMIKLGHSNLETTQRYLQLLP